MSGAAFTPAERALLRASDRVVDQQEPGGVLYRRDRAPAFTEHERRMLAAHDRQVERVFARRTRAWRVTRAPASGGTCPHGTAVMAICERCPVWVAA